MYEYQSIINETLKRCGLNQPRGIIVYHAIIVFMYNSIERDIEVSITRADEHLSQEEEIYRS